MRIGFYAGSCLPVHARSLEERPLAGLETGLLRVAEILSARGHEVLVFSSMADPPPSSNPMYIPNRYIHTSGHFDILVLLKEWKPLVFKLPSERVFYWTDEAYDQYATFGLGDKRVINRVEKLLCASRWQAKTISEKSGFPPEKTFPVGSGVHLPFFDGKENRIRKRIIYAATPYRGLALMPQIFLRVKDANPDAELHVFSGMRTHDTDRPFQGPQNDEFKRVAAVLGKIPGAVLHENVAQQVLARELMRSSVFVLPSALPKSISITAMEAQAAGCPVVASNNSGLVESIQNAGILVEGQPGTEEYTKAFVEAVGRLLSNDKLWKKLSTNGLQRSKKLFSWEHVADRFEECF